MPNIRTLQRSFAGGEVSPEMFGRIDDAKYQTGLARCRNFIVKPQGPAENRAGTAFVREVKDSTKKTRLVPFTYSTTQTMVIEMSPGYFRFHTLGATLLSAGVPYEIANPYAEADLFDIHYVQSADVLTLVHPNYAPRELRRLGATNWQLSTILFVPDLSVPGSVAVTATRAPDDVQTQHYKVTAIKADGTQESLPSSDASCSNNLKTTGAYNTITWSSAVGAERYRVYKKDNGLYIYIGQTEELTFKDQNLAGDPANTPPATGTLPAPTGVAAVATPAANNLQHYFYKVSAIGENGLDESAASSAAQTDITNNLLQSGAYNTITWAAVTGAKRYKIYKQDNGLYGYVGQTDGLTFRDENVTADISQTPPEQSNPFSGAGNYPAAASYFEQRRCFAGTANKPQSLWMTRSGTESNMSYSLPTRDDDSISFRVAAREANTIRHIVPLTQLLLLTSAAEWRVTSINSDAITPSTVSVKPQSYVGASNVQPAIINNTLIYCASRGGHVRELAYSWQASGFVTGDLSLRAPHLFDNLNIVDMAYAKAPQPIVWFVSDSGKLLGLTYVPEQQVGAWHWHDTDGIFESCTVVAEGNEDVLYVVVRRTINGQSKRYVERLASRQFTAQADAFFVDCGATYSGAPATTISGLGHLEGKTVNILADGAVHPQRVVTAGAITLDIAASKVQIGLPITADLQTLPMAIQLDSAFGQGRVKNVNRVWLRVYRSSGIFTGPNENQLTEAKQRTTEPYGTPPALKSDEIEVTVSPTWQNSGGQTFVRQVAPLPLTVVSITAEVAIGG